MAVAARAAGSRLVSLSIRGTGLNKRFVRRQLGWIMEGAGAAAYDVSLEIVGDRKMRRLNRTLRGVRRTTDILSVPLHEGVVPGALPPPPMMDLGDMYVSLPVVRRQAEEMRCPWQERLPIVVAHGVCHLLGYDHDSPEREAEMYAREDEILEYLWDREDEYWDAKGEDLSGGGALAGGREGAVGDAVK